MQLKKANVNKQRATLTLNRANARNTHYVMIKTIKQHNLSNEPINFTKLCMLTDFHIVSQFIREAESWGMIESSYGYMGDSGGCRVLTVTSVGDAFIKYYEQKNKDNAESN
jgi:hypothetical protein